MTRAQFRATLLRRLGRSSTELSNADLDQWIDAGLLDLGTRRFTFRELETTGTIGPLVAGLAAYSRPADAFAITFIEDDANTQILYPWPGSIQSLDQATLKHTSIATDKPAFFKEYGAFVFLFPAPGSGHAKIGLSLPTFYYQKPTMGTDPGNSPNIDAYWHKGVELLAFKYAAADLGDDERGARAEADWNEWFAVRDTPKRASSRHQIPSMPIRPHASWVRNSKTGV